MSKSNTAQDAVVIERLFDAPADLIWKMWTDPAHFASWYGPTGFTIPVANMDLRIGGKRQICMSSPDGSMKMWTIGEFTAVDPTTRLAYTESMSDADGNILSPTAMGMPEGTPTTTEVTVQLEERDGRTKMVMTHAGIPADSPGAGGWNQAFDKLLAHVATVLDDQ